MHKKISLIAAIFLFALLPASHAQNNASVSNAYGFLMLEEPITVRNISMGTAGTALAGPGFRYYNPALPFFGNAHAYAEFGQMPGDVNKGGFETAFIINGGQNFTAVSFHSNSVEFQTTDEHGLGGRATSGTTFGAATLGHAVSHAVGDFALGAMVNFMDDRIWVESSYNAIALGFGVAYKHPNKKLNLGGALFNNVAWSRGAGGDFSHWSDSWSSDQKTVPRFARAGAAWTDSLKSISYTVAADVVHHEFAQDGSQVTVPVGVEAWVLPYIALRVGKRFNYETEIMTAGIGLRIDKLYFDAAFIPTVYVSDYDMKWSMSFMYRL